MKKIMKVFIKGKNIENEFLKVKIYSVMIGIFGVEEILEVTVQGVMMYGF